MLFCKYFYGNYCNEGACCMLPEGRKLLKVFNSNKQIIFNACILV